MKNKTKILGKIAIACIILCTIFIIAFAITFTIAYYQIKEDYGESAEINSFAFSFHHILAFYASYQDAEHIAGKQMKVHKPIIWRIREIHKSTKWGRQNFSWSNDDVAKIINSTKINFLSVNHFLDCGLPKNLEHFPIDAPSLIYLDASSTQLATIPKEIKNFTKLQFLRLDNCPITELPKEIGILSSLKYLDLSNCKITQLPKEIGQLSSLEHLDLSNCKITQLPKEIGQLSSLKYLNLSGCRLTVLPKEIYQLPLKELFLKGNKFTKLPKEFSQLSSLKYLDLSQCGLTEMPKEICKLSSLTKLSLRHNKFTQIPQQITQLTHLEILDLSECELTKIPDALCKMYSLRYLLLIRNNITKLPEVKKFRNFLKLNLADNPIAKTKIPDELIELNVNDSLSIDLNNIPPIKITLIEAPMTDEDIFWEFIFE